MDEPENSAERSSPLLVPAAIVVAGLVIAGAIVFTNRAPRPASQTSGAGASSAAGLEPGAASAATLVDSDDPTLGDPGAKVTIVEFSDFQCPFCQRFWQDTLPLIRERYLKTGKVRFIYRDFPLSSIHPNAEKAAEAAECANAQGKFWAYHDLLFSRQPQFGVENFKRWAGELGMDSGRFASCLDSGTYAAEVAKDAADGEAAGVSGTPTVFVNGRAIVGALPFSEFASAIDAALGSK